MKVTHSVNNELDSIKENWFQLSVGIWILPK